MRPAPHVIVCGAGLTGLTTAWHLRRAGIHVTVVEANDTVGGVIQSTQRDGYLVEHGPNSCMLTDPLAALVDALELAPLLRVAAPQAQRRYIVRDGHALAVPSSPPAMLRSPLFSASAKLRVLAEPFIGRRTTTGDESVASFVRRRLGTEPLTWAVDPFVSGVYAGDPEQLSVRHAFPRLAALEREHGSLIRGMIASARKSRIARGQPGFTRAHATMVSFADGMGSLPRALADSLGHANILRRTRVLAIAHDRGRSQVTVEHDGVRLTRSADAVISTLPLHALATIDIGPSAHAGVARLAAVPYPPVSSLALGFLRADVAHALDGFGMLVPSAERKRLLGVLFSSTLFEDRAPRDFVLLTCFLGGVRQPDVGRMETSALLELVRPELAAMLGVTGAPTFVQHTVWPQAIPQYNLGHDEVSRAADAVEAAVPGLLVDGQFRRGVSVGDCIAAGALIAARAMETAHRMIATRGTDGDEHDADHTSIAPAAVA